MVKWDKAVENINVQLFELEGHVGDSGDDPLIGSSSNLTVALKEMWASGSEFNLILNNLEDKADAVCEKVEQLENRRF
eukprot:1026730-Ditylum_brightwellii.AAC.2